jgi:hypothetical protein
MTHYITRRSREDPAHGRRGPSLLAQDAAVASAVNSHPTLHSALFSSRIDPAKFSFVFDLCSDCFGQKPLPLTHQAAIRENASMSKGIVEETVYVFLFRCEKCNRPIISWMLSPNHGGSSLEKAQTKSLPLILSAIESWAVPWTYAITGPFDQSREWFERSSALWYSEQYSHFQTVSLCILHVIGSGNSTAPPRGGATAVLSSPNRQLGT